MLMQEKLSLYENILQSFEANESYEKVGKNLFLVNQSFMICVLCCIFNRLLTSTLLVRRMVFNDLGDIEFLYM